MLLDPHTLRLTGSSRKKRALNSLTQTAWRVVGDGVVLRTPVDRESGIALSPRSGGIPLQEDRSRARRETLGGAAQSRYFCVTTSRLPFARPPHGTASAIAAPSRCWIQIHSRAQRRSTARRDEHGGRPFSHGGRCTPATVCVGGKVGASPRRTRAPSEDVSSPCRLVLRLCPVVCARSRAASGPACHPGGVLCPSGVRPGLLRAVMKTPIRSDDVSPGGTMTCESPARAVRP